MEWSFFYLDVVSNARANPPHDLDRLQVRQLLFHFSRYHSSWLLVIMSVEKFFILYFPLKLKVSVLYEWPNESV